MKVEKSLISAELPFTVEFYDVDTMGVVWHGNYAKYMEAARCVLLDKIGFGYNEMKKAGFAFPVITMDIRYIRSLEFGEKAIIRADLIEYKDILEIHYKIINAKGEVTTKAETKQAAVKWDTKETQFESPAIFIEKVENLIAKEKEANKAAFK
ncbi:MAG: acyl-CoA thioesterase [Treponema sp.]|nr:acyl-CoA thioesterase [Treponema sp.]